MAVSVKIQLIVKTDITILDFSLIILCVINTVNSEKILKVLFSRNFAYVFCEYKILMKCRNQSVVY